MLTGDLMNSTILGLTWGALETMRPVRCVVDSGVGARVAADGAWLGLWVALVGVVTVGCNEGEGGGPGVGGAGVPKYGLGPSSSSSSRAVDTFARTPALPLVLMLRMAGISTRRPGPLQPPTFAPVELDGSSKRAQIFGLVRCQQVSSPFSRASSNPNRRAIASSDGCSSSSSSLSSIASVLYPGFGAASEKQKRKV
uniref:Uncharacterized protein n=1 Tax=Anopheles atroparvus TaxID=41427 RepID=A0A182JJD5_ANOAO